MVGSGSLSFVAADPANQAHAAPRHRLVRRRSLAMTRLATTFLVVTGTLHLRQTVHGLELPIRKQHRDKNVHTESLVQEQVGSNDNNRRKKILVTSAASQIGIELSQFLLHRGDSVIAIDEPLALTKTDFAGSWPSERLVHLSLYPGSLTNDTLLQEIFEAERPTAICHLATTYSSRSETNPGLSTHPITLVDTHIEATARLMELAHRFGIRQIVLASDGAVYGDLISQSPLEVLSENVSPNQPPLVPYAATKKSMELFAYTWHHLYQIQVSILRLFHVYGPHQHGNGNTRSFMHEMSSAGQAQVFEDYTFIDDIVNGFVRALDKAYPYEIFNLAQGESTDPSVFANSMHERQNELEDSILQEDHVTVPLPAGTRVSIAKARAFLGYAPQVNLDIGIKRTLEWYRSNVPKVELKNSSTDELRHESNEDVSQDRHHRRLQLRASDGASETVDSWHDTPLVTPHTGVKKILVTGGAGFIGSHVADHLLKRGDNVIVIDEVNDYYDVNIKTSNLQMLMDKYGDERLKIYRGDICNSTLLQHIFETDRPEWICHMAARAGVRPSIENPLIYIQSNVKGTTTLLDAAQKYGVRNFVFASSSSVYGGSKSTYFSEDEMVDFPISPYAASKRACEMMAYTYHKMYHMNITALRFFTVYGPRGRPDMAPFQFIDRVSRGVEMKQFGDGSSSRDYTYIDDIVDGVIRALDRPYPYQIFNLGKGSGTRLVDFISLVEENTGNKALIKQLPDQPGDVPYTCADVRKAERLLGYKCSVPFEEGIRRTVAWYQETYPHNLKKLRSGPISDNVTFIESREQLFDMSNPLLFPFSCADCFAELAYIQWLALAVLLMICRVCRQWPCASKMCQTRSGRLDHSPKSSTLPLMHGEPS